MREKVETQLGTQLVSALVLVTLLVTPLWSIDPINPIKLLAVSATAFMELGILLSNLKALKLIRLKLPLVLIIGFMVWQLVVLIVSGGEKLQQFFGTNGRNTGFLTYLAFSIIFVVSMTISSIAFLKRFLAASLVVGIASLGYGVFQSAGWDPIDWVNPYSPVFGFLGNPNFQSSLLGILGAVVFTQLLSGEVGIQIKGAYLFYLLVTLYVINETDSQQGFLVLLIGSGVAFGVFVIQRNRTLGYSYFGLTIVGFIGVLSGITNKGPMASLLYKDSVTYRGDYWRAGWKMTVENPIFGVGLDSYGDWYRRSRTIDATLRRGADMTSNAAHNVFLDFSSYGGFPLVLLYLTLMVLVFVSAIKVIKRSQTFNAGFVGLLAGWLAFQAQSIISINQIGLALWGWVLSGLIIGFEINTRNYEVIEGKKQRKNGGKQTNKPNMTSLSMFVGLIAGILVSSPPYLASANFKSALESTNSFKVKESATSWPQEPTRLLQTTKIFLANNLEVDALEITLLATRKFPDNFDVWATLYTIKSASEKQKSQALAQMKRLDPLNPDLK
jgi:O-antigen ligase